MKKLLYLLLLLFSNICLGQITSTIVVSGGTSGTCPFIPTATWSSTPNGVSISNWNRGSGVSCNSAMNGLNGQGFNSTSLNNGILSNKYYYFTITADNYTPFTLNNINWITELSNTINSCKFSVGYINNGGPLTQLGTTQNITSSGAQNTFLFNGSVNVLAGTSIVIYLIPHEATASTTTARIINGSSISLTTNCLNYTIWNGSSWSNGIPDISKRAIINGVYNTANPSHGNIDCCGLTITNIGNLTINNNQYVNIQNDLTNNGTVNITDGSLVQSNNTTNTGNITYNRTTASSLRGYDYVYWSSPVNNQTLSSIYSTPTMGFKYEWDPGYPNLNLTQGNWVTPTATMTNGKGYIVRASSSYGWGPASLTGTFYGVPNNGNFSTTIQRGSLLGTNDNWNLIGNPYPSSIKITSFLTTNTNIDGYVYLWKHTNEPTSSTSPFYQNFQYNYLNDYLTANGLGSNDASNPNYIATGQGFFVSMTETPSSYASLSGNVNFTNLMRDKTYDNSIFYRQTNTKSRIWLDLLDVNNNPNRILVGYDNEATNGKDRMYDAPTTTGTTTKIYSLINNDPYIIQGRAKFKNNDQVQLGINITTSGEHKIAIAEVDGVFDTQDIYLEDKLLNITHDLKLNPYIFTSNEGIFNNRFILKYKTNNGHHKVDTLIIYNEDTFTKINSTQIIKKVKVYNILGQLLYYGNFNSNDILIELISDQILIFKIETVDGNQITKKVINARY